jgi:hypothetical protein
MVLVLCAAVQLERCKGCEQPSQCMFWWYRAATDVKADGVGVLGVYHTIPLQRVRYGVYGGMAHDRVTL